MCSICLDVPQDPRRIPCLHVFCRDCLDKLISDTRDRNSRVFRCPNCRYQHNIPEKGALAYPAVYVPKYQFGSVTRKPALNAKLDIDNNKAKDRNRKPLLGHLHGNNILNSMQASYQSNNKPHSVSTHRSISDREQLGRFNSRFPDSQARHYTPQTRANVLSFPRHKSLQTTKKDIKRTPLPEIGQIQRKYEPKEHIRQTEFMRPTIRDTLLAEPVYADSSRQPTYRTRTPVTLAPSPIALTPEPNTSSSMRDILNESSIALSQPPVCATPRPNSFESTLNRLSPADIGVILEGPRFGVHTKCFVIFV